MPNLHCLDLTKSVLMRHYLVEGIASCLLRFVFKMKIRHLAWLVRYTNYSIIRHSLHQSIFVGAHVMLPSGCHN